MAILAFSSSLVNHVILGFSLYDASLISMVLVVSILLGSMYVIRLNKPYKLGVNIGGFIIPLAYSLEILYFTYTKTLFPIHVFLIDLLILSTIYYLVSTYIVGYGIGLPVIPTILLTSSTSIISLGCNEAVCIPLSSVLGCLSIIIGVDMAKAMETSLKKKIEFILGGAGINDIVVITSTLTPLTTLILTTITPIQT